MVRIAFALSLSLLSSLAAAAPVQFSARSAFDIETAAVNFVAKQWGVSSSSLWFDSSETTPTGASALLRQETNAQPLWNSFANVVFDESNNVVDFNGQHFQITYVEDNMPTIMVDAAVAAGESALNAQWTDTDFQYTEPDHLGYIAVGSRAKYEYILHFQSNVDSSPITAYISAVNGEIDWVVNTDTGATISSVSA